MGNEQATNYIHLVGLKSAELMRILAGTVPQPPV
jgi:hypothetical protein